MTIPFCRSLSTAVNSLSNESMYWVENKQLVLLYLYRCPRQIQYRLWRGENVNHARRHAMDDGVNEPWLLGIQAHIPACPSNTSPTELMNFAYDYDVAKVNIFLKWRVVYLHLPPKIYITWQTPAWCIHAIVCAIVTLILSQFEVKMNNCFILLWFNVVFGTYEVI